MQIDKVTYGHLSSDSAPKALRDFLDGRLKPRATSDVTPECSCPGHKPQATDLRDLGEIRIGVGSCCIAGGSMKVLEALEIAARDAKASVSIRPVGCVGMCHQTPLVEIQAPGRAPSLYNRARPEDAREIIRKHFRSRSVGVRIRLSLSGAFDRLFEFGTSDPVGAGLAPARVPAQPLDVRDPQVCAFLGPQKHIATEHGGQITPLDLDQYRVYDGFRILADCLENRSPGQVIEAVTQSGLRGRGGAGFPTGRKWEMVRAARSEVKYVICNGDEGDPGAFMDRMLLESFPYRVIEGVAIAAHAVGAHEGILYIRAEYPLAVQRVREAIRRCEAAGILGQKVLGKEFALHLRVVEGAGAFVCGEETALLASLGGERGTPRIRPPYPAQEGFRGQPTLINNVETFSVITWILRNGPQAFAALGTEKSKGAKVFALTGKVRRGGLIEVPMGTTLRQIVEQIGGGVAEGRTLKAIQIGGPSGGCIPASLADTPVDYEALGAAGAIMGSGGLVVMDDTDCMVDIARFFLSFTQDQSCGKCTFCRVGTRRLRDILEKLCQGKGSHADLTQLEELSGDVRAGSLCGLGQTAPNPVLTTLRYFRSEYEAHIEGRCPAGKCRALIHYQVGDACIGCTKCAQQCPVGAIPMTPYEKHTIDSEKCTRCDICRSSCPVSAITVA